MFKMFDARGMGSSIRGAVKPRYHHVTAL